MQAKKKRGRKKKKKTFTYHNHSTLENKLLEDLKNSWLFALKSILQDLLLVKVSETEMSWLTRTRAKRFQ